MLENKKSASQRKLLKASKSLKLCKETVVEVPISEKPSQTLKPLKPRLRPSSAYVSPPPQELITLHDSMDPLYSDEESNSSTSDTEFRKPVKPVTKKKRTSKVIKSGTSSLGGKSCVERATPKRKALSVLLDMSYSSPSSLASETSSSVSWRDNNCSTDSTSKSNTRKGTKRKTHPKSKQGKPTIAASRDPPPVGKVVPMEDESSFKEHKGMVTIATDSNRSPSLRLAQMLHIIFSDFFCSACGFLAQRKFPHNQVFDISHMTTT